LALKKVFALIIIFFMLTIKVYGQNYTLVYLFGGSTTTYLDNISFAPNKISTAAPSYFDLDENGNLVLNGIDKKFIDECHNNNIKVTPLLSNHWDKKVGNAALDNREKLADQIAWAVYQYDLDGVNVDIENVNHLYRDKYTNFVKLLRDRMPNKIITTAVAANPNGWSSGWHGSYDYTALAKYSDYLMLMAYDESYQGSLPGPVASASFVENSIKYALKHTIPDKIVLGIPFYGRYWKEGSPTGGYGITSLDVEYLLANYSGTKTYDNATKSAKAVITIKDTDTLPVLWGKNKLTPGVYTIWYDDIKATEYKISLAKKYMLKGIGCWAIGQEVKEVWSSFEDAAIFDDVVYHWARGSVEKAYDKGWMVGTNKWEFKPDRPITRAEVAVTLVRVANLKNETAQNYFFDTQNHWAKNEIAVARKYNFLQGTGQNLFAPDRYITREEVAQMIDNIFNLSIGVDFHKEDLMDIDESMWSYESIALLYSNKIIKGYPDKKFYPYKNITRAEFATILDNLEGFGLKLNQSQRAGHILLPR